MSRLSFQTTAVMSLRVLTLMLPSFSFSVLPLQSSGIPSWFGLTVLQQFIFCLSNCYISQEKKSNCPYITYGHASLPFYQFFHCSMGCCHDCCSLFSVVPSLHFHVICVAINVTEFVDFNSETFVFFWDVLLECYLPLKSTITLSIAKCWVVKV